MSTISFGTQYKMTLEQLQAADVPKAVTADVLVMAANTPEGQADIDSLTIAMDKYLSIFAKPTENKVCIACGRTLGGFAGALVGGFRYGMAWGEGHCGCGYPGRALHQPKDESGEKLFDSPLQMILQYHPSVLSVPEPDEE